MKETLLAGLYWLLNILIVLAALAYAFKLWGKQNRLLIAIALFVGGFAWHIARAIYAYQTNNCESFEPNDSLLIIANKCIPPMADDIVWAQIAVFVGLFVIIAEIFKHYTNRQNE